MAKSLDRLIALTFDADLCYQFRIDSAKPSLERQPSHTKICPFAWDTNREGLLTAHSKVFASYQFGDITMTSISGAAGRSTSSPSGTGTTGNDLRDVDLNQFLTMLVTEMQNQDPLNPMDNSQFLTQVSQIRSIGSTNQLTETLNTLATGQGLSMASGLIGKSVTALDDKAKEVKGVVDKVSVQTDSKDKNKRTVKVHIGTATVDISNVREIVQASS